MLVDFASWALTKEIIFYVSFDFQCVAPSKNACIRIPLNFFVIPLFVNGLSSNLVQEGQN